MINPIIIYEFDLSIYLKGNSIGQNNNKYIRLIIIITN